MTSIDVKKKTISNLMWRFAERCGAQGVSFIVSIILARLLAPDIYGTVALITVITTILQVFVDSGMGNALIQKKNADDLDYSTVFYFNFVVCIILYAGMFFAAPSIATFYEMPELTPLVRVISLTLVISGIKNIQQAYVSKHLLFKKFFYATIGGTVLSAILGITMAYLGFGCWALVVQQLSNAMIDTSILWITMEWRPKWMFSFERLKGLLSYGWKLLVSSLLDTVYNNMRQLIIGKFYTSSELAFYNKGKQFPSLIVMNINSSIDSVLLPIMSQEQDNSTRIKSMTRKAIRTSSYIMWPLMIGLAIVAEPLISLILTDKWLPCVPYLRIFCFTYALWPIHTANLNAIKAMGRSDMFLKLEIIKKVLGVISIVATLPFGVFAIALGYMVTGPLSAAVNAFPNRRLLNYSFKEQCTDLLPFFLMSGIMGVIIWPVQYLALHKIIIIALQVLVGGFVYIVESKILHVDVFEECLEVIKKKNKR
ncbi:lipopolysaccharide biosynthesis protein [Robinsoniella peoriensis]|uniref:lipopolysaccharide biosynthesis protein n=1 Tax=Robinsoniella peoriensis TaxID=180332 RepID=UPI003750A109